MEDIELIRLVINGQDKFFAELVRRYQTRVLQLCTSLLKDAAAADDAAQEIFLKIYESLSKFRAESSFSTWIYRIASNHCLDLLRKKSRQKTESWDALVEKEGEKIQNLLLHPAQEDASSEAADLVAKVFSQLTPDYRLILDLREVQGLSYQEMAEALSCSLDSIKAKLRRAREDFKKKCDTFQDPAASKPNGGHP